MSFQYFPTPAEQRIIEALQQVGEILYVDSADRLAIRLLEKGVVTHAPELFVTAYIEAVIDLAIQDGLAAIRQSALWDAADFLAGAARAQEHYRTQDPPYLWLCLSTLKAQYTEALGRYMAAQHRHAIRTDQDVDSAPVILDYGQYRGHCITDVPEKYLQWVLRTFELGDHRSAALQELRRRYRALPPV